MVLAIFWGLVLGVVIVACMAMSFGRDGGYDASGWAWIDVVSTSGFSGDSCFRDARAAICSPTSGTPQ
jgi:hypothetical protein